MAECTEFNSGRNKSAALTKQVQKRRALLRNASAACLEVGIALTTRFGRLFERAHAGRGAKEHMGVECVCFCAEKQEKRPRFCSATGGAITAAKCEYRN